MLRTSTPPKPDARWEAIHLPPNSTLSFSQQLPSDIRLNLCRRMVRFWLALGSLVKSAALLRFAGGLEVSSTPQAGLWDLGHPIVVGHRRLVRWYEGGPRMRFGDPVGCRRHWHFQG